MIGARGRRRETSRNYLDEGRKRGRGREQTVRGAVRANASAAMNIPHYKRLPSPNSGVWGGINRSVITVARASLPGRFNFIESTRPGGRRLVPRDKRAVGRRGENVCATLCDLMENDSPVRSFQARFIRAADRTLAGFLAYQTNLSIPLPPPRATFFGVSFQAGPSDSCAVEQRRSICVYFNIFAFDRETRFAEAEKFSTPAHTDFFISSRRTDCYFHYAGDQRGIVPSQHFGTKYTRSTRGSSSSSEDARKPGSAKVFKRLCRPAYRNARTEMVKRANGQGPTSGKGLQRGRESVA